VSLRLLAIDLGAETGRAMLGRLDGDRLEMDEVHRFRNLPVRRGGTLRWDFQRLREGVFTAIGRVGSDRLDAVGVDAWGVDFGLVDASGRLLADPVHYRDRRTRGMLEIACAVVSGAEIFRTTGIQLIPINTLYQLLAMVRSGDPILEAADRLLMIPDLFHHLLCGQAVTEFTVATTSQCFDVRTGTWAHQLLERLGIPRHLFGPVVPPATTLGRLRAEVVSATGAGNVTVIAPAAHDTAAAVVATPLRSPRAAYVSCGTWSLVGVEVPSPIVTQAALAAKLTNEGGVGGRFRLLRNVTGLWLLQECRRAWAARGHDLEYGELTELARQAPSTALIDPDHRRLAEPSDDMPQRIREVCRESGQPEPRSPGAIARTVIESLAVKYAWVLERLESVSGIRPEVVHLVGGGARNRFLCQRTADACQLPVVAGPIEAAATGNLLTQAMAVGAIHSLAQAREVVRRSFRLERYQPEDPPAGAQAFRARLSAAEGTLPGDLHGRK
jgi:rhamnulokinase